jgi:SecD/SecF fusion protein
VNIGEATADGDTYTGFSVVSTVEDASTVAGVVRTLFKDIIDVQTPLRFAQQENETPEAGVVLPVPVEAERLGELIGQELPANPDISAYEGGVAILARDIQPPAPIRQIEERLKVMSRQPEYEAVRFRTREVFPVTATAPGSGLYTAVAVLAVDPAVPYQLGAEQQWQIQLADIEWNLVREALGRETSLAKVSNFTSTVARTIGQQAIMAMVLSFAAIIAYVWFRFGSLRYGLAAILALAHDVIIAMGLVALCGLVYDTTIGQALLLEPFKLNMALIAALLTIVGYSLNDTIVVFDRIRENRGKLAHATAGIINDSINQVISRTLLTSGTTLLAVVWMYVLGGAGIHGFAFALVVGVLVGTYSSIAIASQALLIGAGGKSGGGGGASNSSGADRNPPSRKRLG